MKVVHKGDWVISFFIESKVLRKFKSNENPVFWKHIRGYEKIYKNLCIFPD